MAIKTIDLNISYIDIIIKLLLIDINNYIDQNQTCINILSY